MSNADLPPEAESGPERTPMRVSVGPLRKANIVERSNGITNVYSVLSPATVAVHSTTAGGIVSAQVTAISEDGRMAFVEYRASGGAMFKWTAMEKINPPLEAVPHTSAPKSGRGGCLGVALVIAAGVAAALSQGCGGERREDPRIQEARYLDGHRPRMQSYGVFVDRTGRQFSIDPQDRMSTTRRYIMLPPDASMPVIDEIADPDGGSGRRLLRIRYESGKQMVTMTISPRREFRQTSEDIPEPQPSTSATKR